jgi:hypothetical protein
MDWSNPLALCGQSPPLIVVESQPTFAQLLPRNAVLLAQVIHDLVVAVIHPSGQSDEQETKRIQHLRHVVQPLSRASRRSHDGGKFRMQLHQRLVRIALSGNNVVDRFRISA